MIFPLCYSRNVLKEQQWWLLSEEQQLLLERVDPGELRTMEEEYVQRKAAAATAIASASVVSSTRVTPNTPVVATDVSGTQNYFKLKSHFVFFLSVSLYNYLCIIFTPALFTNPVSVWSIQTHQCLKHWVIVNAEINRLQLIPFDMNL